MKKEKKLIYHHLSVFPVYYVKASEKKMPIVRVKYNFWFASRKCTIAQGNHSCAINMRQRTCIISLAPFSPPIHLVRNAKALRMEFVSGSP